jgi:1-acyl-sn-glycerol-3-phosphate acyltransferase
VRRARGALFALRGWLTLVCIGVPTSIVVLLLPGVERRWRLVRRALFLMQRLSGIHVEVRSKAPAFPCVVVANHSSFIDGAVLIAASPAPLRIAVGAVFEHQRVAGPVLRALGCVFVGDPKEPARAQLARLAGVAAKGHLAVFPEGHLASGTGMERFHLGAFVAAAEAGMPVVPVAIAHSAQVLPRGARAPRRGRVLVYFGGAVEPGGSTYRDARQLARRVEDALSELLERSG